MYPALTGGAVVPELLTDLGALPLAESVWWKVGAAKLSGRNRFR